MRVIDLIRRLRDEFTAMPGLRLSEPQVERLCGTDASTASSALHALVSAGFLNPLPDGSYGRTDLSARAPRMRSPWRRILCVGDLDSDIESALSTAARSALRYATTLAVTHRARITALQVVPRSSSEPGPTPASAELVRSIGHERFRGLIDVRVAIGSPSEQVARVAKDINADLIVIGRSGRHDDESLSRLSETLRQAPCPVLLVHPSGRAAVA